MVNMFWVDDKEIYRYDRKQYVHQENFGAEMEMVLAWSLLERNEHVVLHFGICICGFSLKAYAFQLFESFSDVCISSKCLRIWFLVFYCHCLLLS